MKKTLIVFWPPKGSVNKAAEILQQQIPDSDITSLKAFDFSYFNKYENFIFGCSTVGADNWTEAYTGEQWVPFFKKAQDEGFSLIGKKAAIFGLGNAVLYPNHFIDHVEILYKELINLGAEIVGKWPVNDYDYFESAAEENGYFHGLALDHDNEPDLTETRIEEWVKLLKKEF
jgi:flavodoxin I